MPHEFAAILEVIDTTTIVNYLQLWLAYMQAIFHLHILARFEFNSSKLLLTVQLFLAVQYNKF